MVGAYKTDSRPANLGNNAPVGTIRTEEGYFLNATALCKDARLVKHIYRLVY